VESEPRAPSQSTASAMSAASAAATSSRRVKGQGFWYFAFHSAYGMP
jgi:hypothetical protein